LAEAEPGLELERAAAEIAVPPRPVKEVKLGKPLGKVLLGKLLQRSRPRLLLPDKFLPYPLVGKGKQQLRLRRHHLHRGRALAA
jgi:hypothetical protein